MDRRGNALGAQNCLAQLEKGIASPGHAPVELFSKLLQNALGFDAASPKPGACWLP
jgi:hypothetical protein